MQGRRAINAIIRPLRFESAGASMSCSACYRITSRNVIISCEQLAIVSSFVNNQFPND